MDLNLKKHLIDFIRLSYVKEDENDAGIDVKGKDYLDCALGVNPFGYPDTVNRVMETFDINLINKYPDFPYKELKRELVRYWNQAAELKETNVRLGNGSMAIIEKINKMFIDRNSKVLGYCPQFTDFGVDVQCCGGIYDHVDLKVENNFKFNADDLISSLSSDYRLIYIDNPNNPTGQVIPVSVIDDIVKEAEKLGVCVIVDEAYGDFMENKNSAITLVNKYNNLMVIRSFSKGFGLAGIRVGYLVTGDLLSGYYSKVDAPFSVNSFGYYTALLALKDENFINECKEKVRIVKEKIVGACTKINILETDMRIPIMALMYPDSNLNLHKEFRKYGVLTEAGEDFMGLGKNFVRLRVPRNVTKVVDAIREIERNCKY